jgi:hypothetical protein
MPNVHRVTGCAIEPLLEPVSIDIAIWDSGTRLIRFRLADAGVLFTSGERRRVKGEKASLRHPWLRSPLGLSLPSRQIGAGIINTVQTPIWPLGNPWPWHVPTVGKAPRCGSLFTGREPHAIHGVTLPFAVILTAHRLRSPRRTPRQTAWSLGDEGQTAESKSEKQVILNAAG